MGLLASAAAAAAAAMMTVSPLVGDCEGREVLLCSGSGETHRAIVWDDEGPLPQPSASKACHACTFERKPNRKKGDRAA